MIIGHAKRIFMAVCLGALLCGSSSAQEPAEPYRLVRTLQLLQDQIAKGNIAAHRAQRNMLAFIGKQFLLVPDAWWSDDRNARAGLIYLMSGGDPTVVRNLLSRGIAFDTKGKLTKGILAYVEGDRETAKAHLDGVDPQALPAGLGGHIALVKSVLTSRGELDEAIELLHLARLSQPGTLVEEAALRRLVVLVADKEDHSEFESLAEQYLRRFGDSAYGRSFREQFAALLAKLDYGRNDAQTARLAALLETHSHKVQRDYYLAISRAAIIRGKIGLAIHAAQNAPVLTGTETRQRAQAKLYENAARIFTSDFEMAYDALKQIDPANLRAANKQLLDAALHVAGQIRAWPEPLSAGSEIPAPLNASEQAGKTVSDRPDLDPEGKISRLVGRVAHILEAGGPLYGEEMQ